MTDFDVSDLTEDEIKDIENQLDEFGVPPRGIARKYLYGEDTMDEIRAHTKEAVAFYGDDPDFLRAPLMLKAVSFVLNRYAEQVEQAFIELEKNRD